MSAPRRLVLLGAGRCASSLGFALRGRGYELAGLTCRGAESARAAAEMLGGVAVFPDNAGAALAGEVVLIGVADREIEAVAAELAAAPIELGGRVVLHLSGALDAGVLAPLAARGAQTGSLHPLMTFSERVAQPDWLRGVYFACEGSPAALALAEEMVRALRGHPLRLRPGAKGRYHAAASVASNHLMGLLDLAYELMQGSLEGDAEQARAALLPLLIGSLAAADARGPGAALTGPIVRGDDQTVARHLAALAPPQRSRYAALAGATLALARRSGRIDEEASARVAASLAPREVTVVASLGEDSLAALERRAEAIRARHPGVLIEYRLDWLPSAAPVSAAELLGADILALRAGTPAGPELGGQFLAAGGRFVDVPLGEEQPFPRERTILSWHGPAAEAPGAARDIARRRPAVAKVVIEAASEGDLLALPGIAATLRAGGSRVASFAMGDVGSASRVLPRHFGGDWSYSAGGERPTAAGQLPLAELLGRYGLERGRVCPTWDPGPAFGLAGSPIAHSLSPLLLNGLLPGPYVLFPARTLAPLVELGRAIALSGLSVTMPLKEEAFRLSDEMTPEARRAGSVNTLRFENGTLRGFNTDVPAIVAVAATLLDLAGARVLVLGAGGAARAAAVGLQGAGARVVISTRSPAKAHAAARRIGCASAADLDAASQVGWDLLVNATPVGMGDEEALPIPAERLEGRAVLDLVYHPRETALLRAARGRGLRCGSGLEVFLAQAALQVEIFGGTPIGAEELGRRLARIEASRS